MEVDADSSGRADIPYEFGEDPDEFYSSVACASISSLGSCSPGPHLITVSDVLFL